MDDPCLLGLCFFVQTKDVGGGFHVVDDQRFLILLGEQDVFLEKILLKLEGVLMNSVDASLTDGCDAVFFQEGMQEFEFLRWGIERTEPPWVDAVAEI